MTTDDAFEQLSRADHPRVVGAVRLVVGSAAVAEEISKDAFCRALERWSQVSQHA